LLQCSSSFRPEDAKIAEVVRCWMFFEPSFGLFAIFDGIFALIINHGSLTSEQDISNKLGQIFSQNSSTQNYDPEFKKFKKQKEKTKLNFKFFVPYSKPYSSVYGNLI
jgi:hypothetical protein